MRKFKKKKDKLYTPHEKTRYPYIFIFIPGIIPAVKRVEKNLQQLKILKTKYISIYTIYKYTYINKYIIIILL